jgi:transcriptional regulator with XRE-family HTH domain
MELFDYVGERIRHLRKSCNGGIGLSQDALAQALGIAANTVSRWETGTYRPSLDDLEKLSRFFGVSILEFFPKEDEPAETKLNALLRAAKDLPENDLEELKRYAEYRRARFKMKNLAKNKKSSRPRKNKEETP